MTTSRGCQRTQDPGFLSLASFKTVLAFGFGLEGGPERKLLGASRGLPSSPSLHSAPHPEFLFPVLKLMPSNAPVSPLLRPEIRVCPGFPLLLSEAELPVFGVLFSLIPSFHFLHPCPASSPRPSFFISVWLVQLPHGISGACFSSLQSCLSLFQILLPKTKIVHTLVLAFGALPCTTLSFSTFRLGTAAILPAHRCLNIPALSCP